MEFQGKTPLLSFPTTRTTLAAQGWAGYSSFQALYNKDKQRA